MRLDIKVSQILQLSRNKASEVIKKGLVFVDERKVLKPSFFVEENNTIKIEESKIYVSRAGEKLKGLLDEFFIPIKDKICLDIGSSTGGFVEVLLDFGAKKVVAVDVGSKQLHESLRKNKKIELHENTDIRKFVSKEKFDIVTCDVSFISFKDVAKSVDNFANDFIIILFKPQFEVGREAKRDKKGVLCDEKAINKAFTKYETLACSYNWHLIYKNDSVIKGKEGNLERFYVYKKR